MQPTNQELQDQIAKLNARLADLEGNFYKNNFTSSQTFNKACVFTDRLKVPVYSSAPTVAEVGDIICVSAKLYICTSVGPVVYTLVGSQV